MLTDLTWLKPGEIMPPAGERDRIERYMQNTKIFKNDMLAIKDLYNNYTNRISRVVGNFDEYISFPVLFNYQRLMSLKMADLVCGERPVVTGASEEHNDVLNDIRFDSDFDSKLYSTAIDLSRYGDAVWRIYKSEEGKCTFTVWNPMQWYPIVSQDGTLTELQHVLCWPENRGTLERPDWWFVAQIHEVGYYIQREYKMDGAGATLRKMVKETKVNTGLKINAVMHLNAVKTSDTVYGVDDYEGVDSIIAELMTRIAQISVILDKHADPALTGPVSMLKPDPKTGELKFTKGRFYATSPGEELPKYLTWEGQLEAAFRQCEFLINQLYVLSEMGSALIGAKDASLQAVSGAAMRFKMVNPLAKARRIANSLTKPVRMLFANMSQMGYSPIEAKEISVEWADGLPDDPRENIELVKLATGEKAVMPLETAIVEYLMRTNKEAKSWLKLIDERAAAKVKEQQLAMQQNGQTGQGLGAGAGSGKPGVDPTVNGADNKKGSKTGLKNPSSPKNKSGKD